MSASSVKWVQLGEYIESCEERNSDGKYTLDDVRGISTDKKFIPTKANMDGVSLTSYKVVNPNEFAYVADTSRRGDKIALALNSTSTAVLISSIYTTFRSKDIKKLLPDYLYLIMCRSEFDRYSRFNSWGSARETFDWSEFCRTEIPLPSIEVQQELVDTYNGLKALAEQNEALIEPLSKACEAFIVDCKTKYPEVKLGEYIEEFDKRNNAGCEYPFYGINKDKTFILTVADTNNLDNTKYKVVSRGDFVFSGMQTGRDVCIRIALYDGVNSIIISPAYTTFKVKDDAKIMPQYLFLQFKRFEMDRYGWFLSDGSIRSNLEWERFCEIKLPLPPMEIQRSIVNLYNCLEEAKKIASEAREKLKTLCPALVQRAANS